MWPVSELLNQMKTQSVQQDIESRCSRVYELSCRLPCHLYVLALCEPLAVQGVEYCARSRVVLPLTELCEVRTKRLFDLGERGIHILGNI